MNENLPFLVIGHRGCAGIEPENTLRGIERAIELGCGMVEIDVHRVDGELVVIHDGFVDRTSNGCGRLNSFSFEELRELDFGLGEKIPLLSEVLDLCADRVAVNIELKGEGVAQDVVHLLDARGGVDEVVISSFDWGQLREVSGLSCYPIAVLVKRSREVASAFDLALELGAYGIHFNIEVLDVSLVLRAHALSLFVAVYTVRSETDARKVFDSGADACFVDDPRVVMALL